MLFVPDCSGGWTIITWSKIANSTQPKNIQLSSGKAGSQAGTSFLCLKSSPLSDRRFFSYFLKKKISACLMTTNRTFRLLDRGGLSTDHLVFEHLVHRPLCGRTFGTVLSEKFIELPACASTTRCLVAVSFFFFFW